MTMILTSFNGCGASTPNLATTPTGKPDSLRIQLDSLAASPGQENTIIRLSKNTLVQQLYTEIYLLSPQPVGQACSAVGGPGYTLTFVQSNKILVTAMANKGGCETVTLSNEKQPRQATQTFWSMLNKAITEELPAAKPTQVAILIPAQSHQLPKMALISSASTTQRLYTAIIALPAGSDANSEFTYQLAFRDGKQIITAGIDQKNNRIYLDSNHTTRSGWFSMSDNFKQLLTTTLANTAFTAAQPDQLSISMQDPKLSQLVAVNSNLTQQLYAKITTLPDAQIQQLPGCIGSDKISGKGTWYTLKFAQWNLPILQSSGYEGCTTNFANIYSTGFASPITLYLHDDPALWTLIHHAVEH